MTDYKRVFVDTSPFIYYIEENKDRPQYFDKVKGFFVYCYHNDIVMQTSTVTIEEFCVMPYRNNESERIELFKRFLSSIEVKIVSIDEVIADKAAQIRAIYKHFKPMDALQLASACITGCDVFLTNDTQLKQFKEINVVLVSELEWVEEQNKLKQS